MTNLQVEATRHAMDAIKQAIPTHLTANCYEKVAGWRDMQAQVAPLACRGITPLSSCGAHRCAPHGETQIETGRPLRMSVPETRGWS